MVRKAVYAYPDFLVTLEGSVAAVFAVVHAEVVFIIPSIVGIFAFPLIYLENY